LFLYGGPFFVSCDHRCAHGPGSHGSGANDVGDYCTGFDETITRKVFKINCARLSRADLVFAYINELDCYGTLVELGMVYAQRKRVVLAFGERIWCRTKDVRELWMARRCADEVHVGLEQGWREFVQRLAYYVPPVPSPVLAYSKR
jgi:nucleoside 2-deoxyribosyltransferase